MMKMITMITIRELSPGPQLLQRRAPSTAGSLASLRFIILIMTITFYPQGLHLMTIAMMTMTIHLSSSRSPFGSQQNLAGGQHHSRFDIFIINLHQFFLISFLPLQAKTWHKGRAMERWRGRPQNAPKVISLGLWYFELREQQPHLLNFRGRPVNLVCPSSQLEGYSLARVSFHLL